MTKTETEEVQLDAIMMVLQQAWCKLPAEHADNLTNHAGDCIKGRWYFYRDPATGYVFAHQYRPKATGSLKFVYRFQDIMSPLEKIAARQWHLDTFVLC